MADATPLPSYLATPRRRWLSLVVVCFALALANGPVMCWQTLTPIMIEAEGAFRSSGKALGHLDAIFAMGNGLGALTNLPTGMIYDRIGPRRTAVIGALGTSVGLAGLGACLQFPAFNYGMYFFYPLATIFAFLNSWGAFAYLWLIPEQPSLVNACICAAFSLSDTLGMIAVQLHQRYGLPLHSFFLLLACGACAAAAVSAMLLPDKREFTRFAAEAKAQMARREGQPAAAEEGKEAEEAGEAEEAEALRGAAGADEGTRWERSCLACAPPPERALLRDTWVCCTALHAKANRVILAHLIGLYLLPMSLMLKQYGYYLALLGEHPC